MEPMRRKILKLYAWVLAIGLGYVLWIRMTGLAIPCVVWKTTGLLCPGCGITRMFLALLRLDLAAAFRYNGAALCLFVYWNLVALLCFWGRPGFVRKSRFLYGSLWVSAGILVMYGIVRNIL